MRVHPVAFFLIATAACAGQLPEPEAGAPGGESGSVGAPAAVAPAKEEPREPPPAWGNAESFQRACQERLTSARTVRDAIKAPGAKSAPALEAYNQLLNHLDRIGALASLVKNTHPESAVRELAEGCERELQALVADINLDRGIFDALSAVAEASLDPEAVRFRFKALREFRRAGVDRDDATREKLKKLHADMVQVGQDFDRNIRDGVSSIEVAPGDLAGLPQDFIENHKPNAQGKIVLTTDYPDYFPVVSYAAKEEVRKRLSIAFLNRGFPKNEAALKRLVELRHEYATLLGYPSWAQYIAEDKMVGSAEAIQKFIEEIAKIARPRMTRELKDLLARKQKDVKTSRSIEQWDRFYYVEKVQQEKFGFDSQAARPYFEFTRTLEGMLALYGELFGLRFEKVADAPVWHRSVVTYDVVEDNKRVGRFYLDMHPREGKYNHAAMFPIVTGLSTGQVPEAALVCNFPDPSAGTALLEHDKVTTLFHEFGHLIHHLLARSSPWVSLAGISTEWDFVEAPSQLLEEWTWDVNVLQRFAKHHQSGEAIPAELVEKLRTSSEFGKGTHVMRQVFYTALSFFLHARDPKGLQLDPFTREMTKRYSPYPDVRGTHLYAGFGHLEGYSSMYYTYQWSLVLAKDIFTKFEAAGLLDAGTAREYREKILKVGGAKDAKVLVTDFLGRESSLEAYRRWLERN